MYNYQDVKPLGESCFEIALSRRHGRAERVKKTRGCLQPRWLVKIVQPNDEHLSLSGRIAFIKNDGRGGNTLSKVQEDYDLYQIGVRVKMRKRVKEGRILRKNFLDSSYFCVQYPGQGLKTSISHIISTVPPVDLRPES